MKFLPLGTAAVVFVALASACGGASESDVTSAPDDGGSSSGSSGSSSGSSGSSSGSSGSSGSSSGSSGATDAGTDAAPTDNVFTGAPAYTPMTGRSTQKGEHPNGGNPSKLACMTCHGPAGPGPEWFAGGSVFKDVAATMPAAQIEVRVSDGAGKAVSTYTDNLGNFLITKQTAAAAGLSFPVHSGARNATSTSLMTDATPNGDCNSSSCHGGTQGFIHVP